VGEPFASPRREGAPREILRAPGGRSLGAGWRRVPSDQRRAAAERLGRKVTCGRFTSSEAAEPCLPHRSLGSLGWVGGGCASATCWRAPVSDNDMARLPRFPGYGAEADFYDLCWGPWTDDIEFFRKRLGRPGRLLDLMCGTGRVAFDFARAGWTVDGVDRSVAMLRIARSKLKTFPLRARRQVRFHRGELTGFRLPFVFDAAVIALNSLPLILSRSERVQALRNVHRHLVRSGRLLVHIDTPRSYESARFGAPILNVFRLDQGRRWYVRSLVERFLRPDIVKGVTRHLIVDRSGRCLKQGTSETRTRVLPTAEVVRELREAGFSTTRLFGSYRGDRLKSDSGFAVIEAVA